MVGDFNILENNSNQETKKVDVNQGKAIDVIKSKLSQEDDLAVCQKIVNATLDDVVLMVEKDRTPLLDAINYLTDYQDKVGIMFEKFQVLNPDKKKVNNDAQKVLKRAKMELEETKNVPDTWWNNLLGRKSKIAKVETEFTVAEKLERVQVVRQKHCFNSVQKEPMQKCY